MKPTQKLSPPAVGHIEQRLAAQHTQQAEMLPIEQHESKLVLDKDIVLLEDMHPSAKTSRHESGGTVLSLEVYNGAVAAQDFALGKVCTASSAIIAEFQNIPDY